MRKFIGFAVLGLILAGGHAVQAEGNSGPKQEEASKHELTVRGVFLSDIHYDPFHDPAKVSALVNTPVSGWNEILSSPDSATQAQDFAALQKTCSSSAADTFYTILSSSVRAMRENAPNARFMVVSGDLMAHQFTCRFATLVPNGTQADYTAFVEKTLRFIVRSLRKEFPAIPIYVALGNNDSDCGDYKLDTQSAFLEGAGKILAELALPGQRREIRKQFSTGGYYAIRNAFPLVNTRILVLNDVLLSPRFTDCAANADTAAGTAEITWLANELTEAEARHEKAWVIGHIPPGIDPFFLSSATQTLCAPGSKTVPTVFLNGNALGDTMHQFAGTISLAVFAHTHMDEFRVVQADTPAGVTGPAVSLKMMSSISPVDGNYPSFTLGEVDPFGGQLRDYTVFESSNKTGVNATWSKEYSFRETYGAESFSAAELEKIVSGFQSDTTASSAASQAYIQHYDVENQPAWLTTQWPKYTCSLTHMTVDDFTTCACSPR